MFVRKLRVVRVTSAGEAIPCPIAWIDNFAMRNFTKDAVFDDTLPAGDGLLEAGLRVPLDRLLVETDCPYLAPAPHRGRRNEPAFVRSPAARLADIHGLSLERLADSLWANTVRVFPALAGVAVG